MSLSFRSGPFYSLSGGRLTRRADMAALETDCGSPDDEIRDGFAILHDGQMISHEPPPPLREGIAFTLEGVSVSGGLHR